MTSAVPAATQLRINFKYNTINWDHSVGKIGEVTALLNMKIAAIRNDTFSIIKDDLGLTDAILATGEFMLVDTKVQPRDTGLNDVTKCALACTWKSNKENERWQLVMNSTVPIVLFQQFSLLAWVSHRDKFRKEQRWIGYVSTPIIWGVPLASVSPPQPRPAVSAMVIASALITLGRNGLPLLFQV